MKRHLSFAFPFFVFLLAQFQTTVLSVSTKQEISCYIKKKVEIYNQMDFFFPAKPEIIA